jgi:TonB family protein
MKSASFPFLKFKKSNLFSFFLSASLILSLATLLPAQTQKSSLSLADILIALRSKKATLDERNKILTDAVKERGITFVITREIEKELVNTGADNDLLETLRQKSAVAKVAPTTVSTPAPQPVSTPAPPDYAFYQKRADSLVAKGDLDSALTDYNRAAELNPKEVSIYLNRGLVLFNKKNYEQAIADYDKAIELNPKDSTAFFNRGNSFEKMGDVPKALADYQKAIELDANNEPAKTNLKRIQDEQARVLAEQKKQETPPVAETPKPVAEKPKLPEFVDLGQITAASVVRMVKPVYPMIAQKSNIVGQVVVQVTLDEEGNVTAAKAVSGHALLRSASEDAAEKSKFKPATVGNQAVKAKGLIVYNFSR